MEAQDILGRAERCLVQNSQAGAVLFARVAGSRGFNVAHARSDVDVYAVYAAPLDNVLLKDLDPRAAPLRVMQGHGDGDCAIYEVEHWCQLLVEGDPSALEALLARKMCYTTPEWEVLRATVNVQGFITSLLITQYLNHATSEIAQLRKKVSDGLSTEKCLYHTVRVLGEVQCVLEGSPPMVWLQGEAREHVLDVRSGRVDRQKLLREVIKQHNALKSAVHPPHVLPAARSAELNSWLVHTVRLGGCGEGSCRTCACAAYAATPHLPWKCWCKHALSCHEGPR